MTRSITVDLTDEADRLDDEVADLEAEAETHAADLREAHGSVSDVPPDEQQAWEQRQQEIRQAAELAETMRHYAGEWDGGEFVLQELTGGQLAYVMDETAAAGAAAGTGDVPRTGVAMVETLRQSVQDRPAECPADPDEWPAGIVMWLFDQVDDIGAPADVELGNSSLAAAMATDSEPNS
jgi:hypothetical protein